MWPTPAAPATPLAVTVDGEDDDVLRLQLRGELDVANYAVLEDALREAERAPQPSVVVDLADLTFCDSGGVILLLQADRRAVATGRSFTLVNPAPSVMRLLELITATHLLHDVPSLEPQRAG